MPATPADARDLLIAAVQSPDPVLYIDDRWLYDLEAELPPVADVDLNHISPRVHRRGSDVTLVGAGHSVRIASEAADMLAKEGISCEVVDQRVLNPFNADAVCRSVKATGRLVAIDGGWSTCGLAGELIASVAERLSPSDMRARPVRITLPDAPAPTSKELEATYYPTATTVAERIRGLMHDVVATS